MTIPVESENDQVDVAVEPQSVVSLPPDESPSQAPEQTLTDSTATTSITTDNDDDDDDLTIIGLDYDPEEQEDPSQAALAWIEQNGQDAETRRRSVLLRELQRVQRASFFHFILLCLIPISLLVIVLATVLGDDQECSSEATDCSKEPRSFMNAFTSRCICTAIDVAEEQT